MKPCIHCELALKFSEKMILVSKILGIGQMIAKFLLHKAIEIWNVLHEMESCSLLLETSCMKGYRKKCIVGMVQFWLEYTLKASMIWERMLVYLEMAIFLERETGYNSFSDLNGIQFYP